MLTKAERWLNPLVMTHLVVSADIERSTRFYTEVLGGHPVLEGEPTVIALANGWMTINVGGGPTEDKPTVRLEVPPGPDRVSSFLNNPSAQRPINLRDILVRRAECPPRGQEGRDPLRGLQVILD